MMNTLPSLRSKVTKGIALVAALNLATWLLILLLARSTLTVSITEEYLQSLGRFVDADIRYVLLVRDRETTDAYVEGLTRFPWVQSVRLLDPDGRTLGSAGLGNWDPPATSYTPSGTVRLVEDNAHLTRTIEIEETQGGSRIEALLHLSIRNETFREMTQRVLYFLIAVVGFVTAGMLLMSQHLARRATQAVTSLSTNLQSVDPERGDLRPVHFDTDIREFDSVQRSVNALIGRIVEHNDELERRIEARTRDLARALREKQAVEETRSSLIMNLSHDLRTPLTATIGYLDHALEEIKSANPDEAVLERSIEHARVYGATLSEEVTTLLQYSISAEELDGVARQPVNIRALLEEAIKGVEEMRARARNTIELAYSGELNMVTVGQPIRFIVDNLLSNACRYCTEGRIVIRCHVAEQFDLSVSDSGPGVPPDEQERIFEPHYRSSFGNAIGPKGMGIGLSLAKTWVDRLGGSITLDSAPGRTVFHVVIPSEGG